jgi:hypothetical protein
MLFDVSSLDMLANLTLHMQGYNDDYWSASSQSIVGTLGVVRHLLFRTKNHYWKRSFLVTTKTHSSSLGEVGCSCCPHSPILASITW